MKHSVLAHDLEDMLNGWLMDMYMKKADAPDIEAEKMEERLTLIDQKLSGVREAFLAVVRDTNIEQIRPIWESLKLED